MEIAGNCLCVCYYTYYTKSNLYNKKNRAVLVAREQHGSLTVRLNWTAKTI